MNWTTWEKIGIDRQACAWFIKKYVDADATFFFIPREAVIEDKEYSFDTPTSKWTHKQGHSTFYMFVKAYLPKDTIRACPNGRGIWRRNSKAEKHLRPLLRPIPV